jgi:hypothetical protein
MDSPTPWGALLKKSTARRATIASTSSVGCVGWVCCAETVASDTMTDTRALEKQFCNIFPLEWMCLKALFRREAARTVSEERVLRLHYGPFGILILALVTRRV